MNHEYFSRKQMKYIEEMSFPKATMVRWTYFPLLSGLGNNTAHSVTAEDLIIFSTKRENARQQCLIPGIITAQTNHLLYVYFIYI